MKNESMMPKGFTFEVLNGYKFTCICLTCSFLLVSLSPRPNSVRQWWENITRGDCALNTSDIIIMTSLL